MLRELRIVDFAIIDEALIEFGPGLNVLTGETGAGKSILIEALGIALGGRAHTEMIRSSREHAAVETRFDIAGHAGLEAWLKEQDIDHDGEIILRRTVSASGRSKAFVNGAMATIAQTRAAGLMLVDIHGQNEHQTLLDPHWRLRALDRFSGLDGEREAYETVFEEMSSARRRLESAIGGRKEMERRIGLLNHQVDEIAAAALEPGEDDRLEREKTRLTHAEALLRLAGQAVDELDEREDSASSLIHRARAALDQAAGLDPGLVKLCESVAGALYQIEEAAGDLRSYMAGVERDPVRLEQVDDRLELIKNLKRKYGGTIEEIFAFQQKARDELEAVSFDRDNANRLQQRLERLETEASTRALKLDAKRVKAAGPFSKKVEKQLADLNMDKAVLQPGIEYERDEGSPCVKDGTGVKLGPEGIGLVEFLFSANPGEPPKPLSKVASGGEISRVMLAIKTVLTGAQAVPVMIFDEIDAGIGGATADRLGEKLKDLARSNQVFCITHLAQVARYADHHFKVSKEEAGGRVRVSVAPLGTKAKVVELARMAGGSVGELADRAAIKWAKEALADAQRR